ncbi:MAG: Type IV fimbrial assembly, ATPase PilB [Candidatus Ozemobacter sibiricus]|uniref:histidine kinase n=1 Tax=Candidatus Ozemobacter sibiricus TaxID=2268124 RepID=A0A367ZRM2_9BACT|nr:MAG: Type IV fimbrial assembly, ATPase PilB [Candidatus Ozemobacter sibiricus]
MDEAVFLENFPAFPQKPDDLQKLSVLLRNQKILAKEEWDALRKEKTDPAELIKAIATRPGLTPRLLAEIEATLLNVPFLDLDEIQIPSEVLKLMKVEVMVEHKIIPVKLNGPELLVGMLAPANADLLASLATGPLAMRPGKILLEPWQKKITRLTETKKPAGSSKKGPRKRLGDILIDAKYITEEQLKEAIEGSKKDKLRLGAYLVKKGFLTNKQLSIALSKQFDLPFVDLDESLVDPGLATLLPKKLCYDQILCPVKREDNKLILAMTDPTDIITIDHIEMMTGMRISPVVSSELSIMAALGKLYGESVDALADQVGKTGSEAKDDLEGLGELSENDAPIIKLVNLIFTQAVQMNASDIHIECFENELRVRMRKDGMLRLHMTPTKAAHAGLVSRIKVMANLDIAETRLPQDGRIKLTLQNRKVDMRVSIIPCIWGEKVCIRLLDQGNLRVNLNDLGFEPHVLEKFMEGIKQPNGIVLVTGPTGSGKTTTLYSSLFLLNNPAVNIMTAEDPVEYNLMGINQVQCHPDIGLDFAAALRSFLRQDPNIVMIGEIRDFETASIAIKAAMTGHLVISTLHTNDAPSTVARLLNMGIEPFSLSTSVRVVEAQRLVRKICKSCYTEYKPQEDLLLSLGINQALLQKLRLTDLDLSNLTFAKGAGCPDCDNSGYKGRQGIYEVLVMTQRMRELVEAKANTEEMRAVALAEGMLSLRESAIYKLLTKRTTVEEIHRTTLEAGSGSGEGSGGGAKGGNRASAGTATTAAAKGPPPTGVAIPEIGTLTQEIQAFRTALQRLAGGEGTPMATIESEILKQNLTDPLANIQAQVASGLAGGDVSKALPLIQAQSQKMDFNLQNLVHHFSDLRLQPRPFNLNELVDKEILGQLKQFVIVARLLSGRPDIGQGLKVTKNLLQTLPPVLIDPAAFRVIAANLLVNALTALPKGGEIKLMTRLKPNARGLVELIVFDNGCGIPADLQPRLFTPFQSFGRKTLGLGLAVTRRLITACHGQVTVKSTPGANTLVTVEFATAA